MRMVRTVIFSRLGVSVGARDDEGIMSVYWMTGGPRRIVGVLVRKNEPSAHILR